MIKKAIQDEIKAGRLPQMEISARKRRNTTYTNVTLTPTFPILNPLRLSGDETQPIYSERARSIIKYVRNVASRHGDVNISWDRDSVKLERDLFQQRREGLLTEMVQESKDLGLSFHKELGL